MRRNEVLAFLLIGVLFVSAFSSCAVKLYSDYDHLTDEYISIVYSNTLAFFYDLDVSLAEGGGQYDKFITYYNDTFSTVDYLIARAQTIEKNDETIESLRLLKDSLMDLQYLHQQGFDRRTELQPLESAFDSHFRALLALEAAKRR